MKLLIRADANAQIGSGHVMRTLAVAQEHRIQGGTTLFVMALGSPTLESRLASEGMEFLRISTPIGSDEDAAATVAAAKRVGATWIVADGYKFDESYQRAIKAAGLKLMVVDDYVHADHFAADLVLNPNLHAHAAMYPRKDPKTRLLLGPSYAPLRQEFSGKVFAPRFPASRGDKLLVTLGGGDLPNVTLKVLKSLRPLGNSVKVRAIVGVANPHRDSLAAEASSSPIAIELLSNVANMPELMAWADAAVSGGGSTCWEMAYMGLPAAHVIIAENQRRIAESLAAANASIDLGWHELLAETAISEAVRRLLSEPETRERMTGIGKTLVDGQGASRIVAELRSS